MIIRIREKYKIKIKKNKYTSMCVCEIYIS